jgi:hypothetical protein
VSFKPEQRRIALRGRSFHFVAYEAHAADARRHEEASPAMWCLMLEGRRYEVFPWDLDQTEAALDVALLGWLEDNTLGARLPPGTAPT